MINQLTRLPLLSLQNRDVCPLTRSLLLTPWDCMEAESVRTGVKRMRNQKNIGKELLI